MRTITGKQYCPYCGDEIKLEEGHALTLRFFAPKNHWGIEHFSPKGEGYCLPHEPKGKAYCGRFGYSFGEAVAVIQNSFVKLEK